MFMYKNRCVLIQFSCMEDGLIFCGNCTSKLAPFIFSTLTQPCDVTSAQLCESSHISLYVLSNRKTIKMLTCCAPNCLLTEKPNPEYSFFTLPRYNKFKLDSWLKKLKLFHPSARQVRICQCHFKPEFFTFCYRYIYGHLCTGLNK